MSDRALDEYLNDHLGGAMLGSELAEQIRERHQGAPLGALMDSIAREIKEDRETLVDLMERMNISRNPIKQVAGWVMEKASRLKFSHLDSNKSGYGGFMALESLVLGVTGKARMWKMLLEVRSQYPALASTNLDELLARAERQRDLLERERLALGARALANSTART